MPPYCSQDMTRSGAEGTRADDLDNWSTGQSPQPYQHTNGDSTNGDSRWCPSIRRGLGSAGKAREGQAPHL